MGADLIGYLVKGPVHLVPVPAAMLDESIDPAEFSKYMDEQAEQFVSKAIGNLNSLIFEKTSKTRLDLIAISKLPDNDLFLSDTAQEIWRDAGYDADTAIFSEPAPILRDAIVALLETWHGGTRDVASRIDPDDPTQLLLFAGEMTWGDEPGGDGYAAIRDASALGLLELFGIR